MFGDMRALKTVLYLAGSLAAVLYILNPGAGVFELIPDNLPFVGNLDEAAAMTLLFGCLRALRSLRAAGRPDALPADSTRSEAA
jgi:uncharacterized membrane protein YkvA (DUF1232 family)